MTKQTDRKQDDYNKLIGRDSEGNFVFVDYIFEHNDGFKGATGTTLQPVSAQEYEDKTSVESLTERLEDLWRESVSGGHTDQGLSDWIEYAINTEGEESLAFDTSYSYSDMWYQIRAAFPEYNEVDYPFFECSGGGRMFDQSTIDNLKDIKETNLVNKIKKIEGLK